MFKPHVTVACVVHACDKFLIVEETINGKALWNQPAGHLEANETLLQAAERELWKRPAFAPRRSTSSVCISGWLPITRRFCASCSPSNLAICAPLNRTTAISIAACGSVLRKF